MFVVILFNILFIIGGFERKNVKTLLLSYLFEGDYRESVLYTQNCLKLSWRNGSDSAPMCQQS